MNGPRDCHTVWSNSDREWQISWYCLPVESKKMCRKLTYKTELVTDVGNKLMVAWGKMGGISWEIGIDI